MRQFAASFSAGTSVPLPRERTSANWAETHVAGPFDEEQAANARGFFLGDYEGMVTIGNVFGPFYDQAVSRAANNPSDVFYSTLTP